jgi:hypothetical protein
MCFKVDENLSVEVAELPCQPACDAPTVTGQQLKIRDVEDA